MPSASIAVLLACLAPVAADGPRGDESATHQGTWSVTSMVRDGKEAPADVTASIRRVVEDDHVTWTRDGKSFAGTKVTFDASKSPNALDLIPDGGPHRGKRILGIYRLEGDALTICVADPDEPRPAAFDAPAGSKRTLQRFKRIPDPPSGSTAARLQGRWAPTALVGNGRSISGDRIRDDFKVIKGDRMIAFKDGKETGSSRFELDTTRTPSAIVVIPETGPLKGERLLGIFRLDREEFLFCIGGRGKPRPTGFEAREGTGELFQSFRRIKP